MEVLLDVQKISRSYGTGDLTVKALSGVSFSLVRGEFVALEGPSGSGKTTLLNIAGLCDAPSEGSVMLDGRPVDYANDRQLTDLRRSRIGYVFQFQNLVPHLTAVENAALPLLLNRVPLRAAIGQATELLHTFGLGHRLRHYPAQLSGGEAQRVGLARAVAHSPLIIVADEPTASLDGKAGAVVLAALKEFASKGTAVLMATHSPVAIAEAQRVISLSDGRVR